MCECCVDLLNKYFPDVPEKDAVNILWSATSFPFGSPERVEDQLKEFFETRRYPNV